MAETYVTLSSLKHYDEKIKGVVAEKQDKLVGTDGQIVSFDSDGNVISKTLEVIDTSEFAKTEELNKKLDKENPNGNGSLSLNRKSDTTIGDYSVSVGDRTTASGKASFAEGCLTTASAPQSHAEGDGTVSSGIGSHSEGGYVDGVYTTASGNYAHAEGVGTNASDVATHTEGYKTVASAPYAHAEGYEAKALAGVSHAEGFKTTASGLRSHAEGIQTATGTDATAAHAEGWSTQALGVGSHAEGLETIAKGLYSHTEGGENIANGKYSHVEGLGNNKIDTIVEENIVSCSTSLQLSSTGFGKLGSYNPSSNITGNGDYVYNKKSYKYYTLIDDINAIFSNWSTLPQSSYYEGYIDATPGSDYSGYGLPWVYSNFVLTNKNTPSSTSFYLFTDSTDINGSLTEPIYSPINIKVTSYQTVTTSELELIATHVQGKYSVVDKEYAHIVGGGTSDTDRKNIHTIDWDGNAAFSGDVTSTKEDGTKVSLTDVEGKVSKIEKDYLKSSDKTELTSAIATAKQEAINTILGEKVDADFDTLTEVAEWIQSDTTNSAELVTRVTNTERDIDTLESSVSNKVDKISGKGLSTNDLTSTLKSNYDKAYTHSQSTHAPTNAEKNTIVGIQKNGTDLTVDSSTRKVNISVPTKISELTNDSGFKTTDNNTTYSLSKSGSTITLTGSDGSTTSVTDSDTNTITTVTTSGSGNAITSITSNNGAITATKGSTFLTAHPTVTKSTDTTSTASPSHGGTFTAVDSITRDGNGHVTKVNVKTVTLPSSSSLMTKHNPSGSGTFSMNGIASGENSVAFGENTEAIGRGSYVEGNNNTTLGDYSHVEGISNNIHVGGKQFVNISSDDCVINQTSLNTATSTSFSYDGENYSYMMTTPFYNGTTVAVTLPSIENSTGNYKGTADFIGAAQFFQSIYDVNVFVTTVDSGCGVQMLALYHNDSTLHNSYSGYYLSHLTLTSAETETPAIDATATHVQGKYSLIDKEYAHVVGNGTSETNRSNAHTLDWDGNAVYAGDVCATDSNGNLVSLLDVASNSGETEKPFYIGTCSTSGSTAAKTVSITGFELKKGVEVHVKFSNTNTSSSSTLNVSSTGAKAMYYKDGTRMYYIPSGIYHTFEYDGTYWRYLGSENAILSGRSYERYGLKMSGSTLIPIDSSYVPTLGNYSYPLNLYANTATVNNLNVKTGSSGTTKVLPPLPLLYGHFVVSSFHSVTFDASVYNKYAKILRAGYVNSHCDGTSSGCASGTSNNGNNYDALFLFRVIGYDTSSSMQVKPFVQDVLLSTANMTGSCADYSSEWSTFTTPCGNNVTLYLTGISVDSCGYISGTPALNIMSSSMVHFSEIDIMP